MATASRLLEGAIAATSSGLAAQDLRKSRKSDAVFCVVKMSLRSNNGGWYRSLLDAAH
jgi:hypothetical protein